VFPASAPKNRKAFVAGNLTYSVADLRARADEAFKGVGYAPRESGELLHVLLDAVENSTSEREELELLRTQLQAAEQKLRSVEKDVKKLGNLRGRAALVEGIAKIRHGIKTHLEED
jgi:hypothetical protein